MTDSQIQKLTYVWRMCQDTRADNIIKGSRREQLETIRQDIRTFKEQNQVSNACPCVLFCT